jgi:Ser/Thr protein kinase RdoA (MazF antagonist)
MTDRQLSDEEPFALLTPDFVMDAVESLGFLCDARVYPLNSYENRVYQVGIEEAEPLIAKFYRPGRWSPEQIEEEHRFSADLAELELSVVAPWTREGASLFNYRGYPFALYPRKAGHAPELDNLDHLYQLGQHLGRIHALGAVRPFVHRPSLTLERLGRESQRFLLQSPLLPGHLQASYKTLSDSLLTALEAQFARHSFRAIRLHGDCHPGNILWRDGTPNFVDLDDACNGPAVQDLWMLLSGDRLQQQSQLEQLVEGYEEFQPFDRRELALIESLRSLRLMHYAAWLARRWGDPAFPRYFPWFGTEAYWQEHLGQLREQQLALQQEPLRLYAY